MLVFKVSIKEMATAAWIFSQVLLFMIYGVTSVNVQFYHKESVYVDSTGDGVQYEDDGAYFPREKRSADAEWTPDYDMYEKWAKDYYKNYEQLPLVYRPEDEANKTKIDVLNLISGIRINSTMLGNVSFRRRIQYILLVAFGVISAMFICCCIVCIFRVHFMRSQAHVTKLKRWMKVDNAEEFIKSFQHGKFVNPDGSIDDYEPSDYEKRSLINAHKRMIQLKTELI